MELNQNFPTDREPELQVMLHIADFGGLKTLKEDYHHLDILKGTNDSQKYISLDNADLSHYGSIAINLS